VARGQRDTLVDRKKDIEAAEFFGVVDGIYIFEMEDGLASVVLAEPAIFNRDRFGLGGISCVG
jgi:hypothetical protein